MRNYELILILTPGLEKSEQEKIFTKIDKMITDMGGKIGKISEWGRRQLAYSIKKQKEGVYFLLNLELSGKEVGKIEEKLKPEDMVLRHLLVRKE